MPSQRWCCWRSWSSKPPHGSVQRDIRVHPSVELVLAEPGNSLLIQPVPSFQESLYGVRVVEQVRLRSEMLGDQLVQLFHEFHVSLIDEMKMPALRSAKGRARHQG